MRSSDETCRTSACVYCVAATPLTTRRSLADESVAHLDRRADGAEQRRQRHDDEPEQDQSGERAGSDGKSFHLMVKGLCRCDRSLQANRPATNISCFRRHGRMR